jgi:hypothetical protein
MWNIYSLEKILEFEVLFHAVNFVLIFTTFFWYSICLSLLVRRYLIWLV